MVLTIWGASRYGLNGGLGTIHEGACIKTKNLATWLHLAINVLGTLLLGASNYAMQCLSSPSHEEIDKAHKKGIWLDIGVPSMRNLRHISRSRFVMWFLIAVSSIPLHLMYNSAVFSSVSARDYRVFTVTRDFLTGAPFDVSGAIIKPDHYVGDKYFPAYFFPRDYPAATEAAELMFDNLPRLRRLENKECIEEYSKDIISGRSHVLMITSDKNDTNSLLDFWPSVRPNFVEPWEYHPPWPCDYPMEISANSRNTNRTCDVGQKAAEASTWHMNGRPIEYCLSQLVQEHCQVQFSVAIMAVIIACNVVKIITVGYIAWTRPLNLVTLGDAVASFLDKADKTTKGNCLASKARFLKFRDWEPTPLQWEPVARYWFHAVSKRRWLVCNIL